MTDIWLHVPVNPEPWAIGPVGYARRNGKMSAYVGRNAQLDAYKQAVAEAVSEYWGNLPVLEGKFKVHFYFWRNQAEYTTAQSRQHRKHEADATNLQKATEDALQGIVFSNDKDNKMVGSVVMAQGPSVVGQIVINIQDWDQTEDSKYYLSKMPDGMIYRVNNTMFSIDSQVVSESDNSWPPKKGF